MASSIRKDKKINNCRRCGNPYKAVLEMKYLDNGKMLKGMVRKCCEERNFLNGD